MSRTTKLALGAAVISLLALALAAPGSWRGWLWGPAEETDATHKVSAPPPQRVKLSKEAKENLKLAVKPLKLQAYARVIELPGTVVDRPSVSDRGVSAPVTGVVTAVHVRTGQTVSAGEPLLTLRLTSEYLQTTQTELHKASQEIVLTEEQKKRLEAASKGGAIPGARLIEVENQLQRFKSLARAYRQELQNRGLTREQIEAAADGQFVTEITIPAPVRTLSGADTAALTATGPTPLADSDTFEVQSLSAELGRQVQAGELLCVLADHRELLIEGRAFREEAPLVRSAAEQGWQLEVDFSETELGPEGWADAEQRFAILNLGNTIDPESRTFPFFLPLANQARTYVREGKTYLAWRYRPGQRARIRVPVEKFSDVFVVPVGGISRVGPETFVYRQNGEFFERKSVRVLFEDRLNAVVRPSTEVTPGIYVAQNGAAQLDRILKSQSASGEDEGVHVHADGSVHGAH